MNISETFKQCFYQVKGNLMKGTNCISILLSH